MRRLYEIRFTSAYKRSYKLLRKRGLDLSALDEVVDQLSQGRRLDERYRDHALSGEYAGLRECHIRPDWLLLYMIENDVLILTLIDTGTHSDIFE